MRIAFAGNPNSGKTTIYNALTGRSEKVGNWGGVTVGRKEYPIKSEFGIPLVVALNKADINEKEKTVIDVEALEKKLGCPVVSTTAIENKGLAEVVEKAIALNGTTQKAPYLQADIDLHDKNAVDKEDRKRYKFVNDIVSKIEKRTKKSADVNKSDAADKILLNPIAGILVFAAVMWFVFWVSQAWLGPIIADWLVGYIEMFQEWVAGQLENSPPILSAILADGIVGGVGAVIGFLPLVMVMYFLIALLEDSGYMARVSAVMDPIFKRVGLSGKSVIPVVIGTGCGIPAIMSCRTIRDERERRATTMLTTFIPCGAKIPVIALFAGAFFAGAGWVSLLSYFFGLVLIFLGALLIKAITGYKYRKSFFIMELPKFKVPSLKFAFKSMMERAKAYIIKAATIILICNTVVQIMQTFNWQFQVVEEGMENTSILASIASPFAFLLIPLGFGVWQLAAAAITGFIAKETTTSRWRWASRASPRWPTSSSTSIPRPASPPSAR